jgi:hypothetical protein
MITELILYFLSKALPLFLFLGSLFFIIFISYVFLRCMRKQEKLSESLTKTEKQYFYLAITYIFTYIIL